MQISGLGGGQMRALQQQMFQRMDADGDGKLSSAELTKGSDSMPKLSGMPKTADIMKSLDTDGDGSLSSSEFEAGNPLKTASSTMGHGAMQAIMQLMFQGGAQGSESAMSFSDGGMDGMPSMGGMPPMGLMGSSAHAGSFGSAKGGSLGDSASDILASLLHQSGSANKNQYSDIMKLFEISGDKSA